MILLSLDLETTGTDPKQDQIIELGAVLYSTGLHRILEATSLLFQADKQITPEVSEVTGLIPAALVKFGYDQSGLGDVLIDLMDSADAMIGYNARRFDKRVLQNWSEQNSVGLPDKPWIDLFQDLPWTVPTGKLSHVAADHGLLNLFPHSALADCLTVLSIAAKYNSEELLQRAMSPTVILVSHADRTQNDVVKKWKFRWNPSMKIWWRAAKQQDANAIINSVPFKATVEKALTIEELDQ